MIAFDKSGKQHSYLVQVDKKEKDLIKQIKDLAKDLKKLLKQDSETLPRIYFDNHLYVPILLQDKKIDKISPAGLVKSEETFVKGLRDYLKIKQEKFKDCEIYLMRNFPGSGVGFQLTWSGFYYVGQKRRKSNYRFY